MSKWLEAAKRAPEAEPAQAGPPQAKLVLSVLSVLSEGGCAEAPPVESFPHGLSAGGRPKTWTGRIVSLDEWRNLTEGEKHGQDGTFER